MNTVDRIAAISCAAGAVVFVWIIWHGLKLYRLKRRIPMHLYGRPGFGHTYSDQDFPCAHCGGNHFTDRCPYEEEDD